MRGNQALSRNSDSGWGHLRVCSSRPDLAGSVSAALHQFISGRFILDENCQQHGLYGQGSISIYYPEPNTSSLLPPTSLSLVQLHVEHSHSLLPVFWWRARRPDWRHQRPKVRIFSRLHMLVHRLPTNEDLQWVHLPVWSIDLLDSPAGRGALALVVMAELDDFKDAVFEV